MASLKDLLNPTFLIFLGILGLVAALLVIYFESKLREQNHKFTSMLSLVSSLAEEVNSVKYGYNNIVNIVQRGGGIPVKQNLEEQKIRVNHLIEVSDNEFDDESEDESDDDSDNEIENDSDEDSEDSDDEPHVIELNDKREDVIEISDYNIKILKLEQTKNDELDELVSEDDFEELDNDLESLSENEVEEKTNELIEETLPEVSSSLPDLSELKKINISDLEEVKTDVEYKKMPIQKLRSLVLEKNLVTDSSKLKKNDLLKLLGEEV
jgi:hypothetical protein